MTPPVVWLPEADAELKAARAWYDDVRPELGERFARAVDATVRATAPNPLQFQLVHRGLRRAGVRRFPYGVFLEIQGSRILVIACSTEGAIPNAGKFVKPHPYPYATNRVTAASADWHTAFDTKT